MRTRAALLAGLLAGPALAGEPMSAIDWLSDSLRGAPGGAGSGAGAGVATDARPGAVTVTTLTDDGAPLAGTYGGTDLPRGLWDGAPAGEILRALGALPDELPGRLDDLVVEMLTARAGPPVWDGTDRAAFLVGRIDALLARGRLEAAGALAGMGGDAPEAFRRRFDIALLTGDETAVCQDLAKSPGLSPTWPARVFCLARNGDFDAAALTFGTAESLGMLSPGEDALLAMFLDPELFADEDLGAPPRRPSPLEFRLWEAVGERLPTQELPLAFAHADLSDRYGWKTRLDAAERLAAAGAIPAGTLFDLYAENREAASGGLWDRVAAVAEVRAALDAGDAGALASALPGAWDLMRGRGLGPAFAETFAPKVGKVPLDGEAGRAAIEMALLAPGPFRRPDAGGVHGALADLAAGLTEVSDEADARVVLALSGPPAKPAEAPGLAALRAMADVAAGSDGDMARLANGVRALREAGFGDWARRAAVAVLLGPPSA